MDTYKVWSMSSDRKETEFKMEFEVRINAQNRMEAIAKAQREVGALDNAKYSGDWSWMATRLP